MRKSSRKASGNILFVGPFAPPYNGEDRKSTRLNSSHVRISYAVFCLNDPATTEIYTLSLHDALPILDLLDNPEEARRLAEALKGRVATHFSATSALDKIEKVYAKILS